MGALVFLLTSPTVLTMMAAGHETTASALLWASYAMVRHPDTQMRLRGEILTMLAKTPTPGYAEIEGIKYLNNFCKEVLRLYCPGEPTPFLEGPDEDLAKD